MKRHGRFRCGADNRVLFDPSPRRTPERGERHAYDVGSREAVEHLEYWSKAAPRHLLGEGTVEYRAQDGLWRPWQIMVCPCGIQYALDKRDLMPRSLAAAHRGEDVILTEADRDRATPT